MLHYTWPVAVVVPAEAPSDNSSSRGGGARVYRLWSFDKRKQSADPFSPLPPPPPFAPGLFWRSHGFRGGGDVGVTRSALALVALFVDVFNAAAASLPTNVPRGG